MIERLPTPWGLVRSGVAPDHPKIKSVTRVYEKTAAHPRFRYFGNVTFGEHVSREEMLERYHAVVYATGSPSDRAAGDPRRRPARLARRHGVRGLVQRPPRLHRPRGRPALGRAGGDHRQRQRGARRGADAGAGPRGAGADRHGRPRPRGARPQQRARGPGTRAAGTRAGGLHQPRADRARRSEGSRRDRRSGRTRAGPRGGGPQRRNDRQAQRRDPARLRLQRAAGTAQADRAPLPALPHRADSPTSRGAWGRSSWSATSWSPTRTAGCAHAPPRSTRRCRRAWCSARSATAASPCRTCPSTSARR